MPMPLSLLLIPVVGLVAQGQPRIAIDALHHDFGKISGDNKVSHRFKVTNQGKANLNITRLNPSCGCTSTVLGKWTLTPGEGTEIEVTFNPAGFRGLNRKSLQVVSDDPANPIQTLTFEAEVVREISASTESVFFQDVVRSVPRKASVKLESGNGKPVQIIEAKPHDAPWLWASSRQAGNDAWIDLLLDTRKAPTGKQLGADVITVRTSNPRVPSINISVQWELRPSVVAEPVRVAWVEPAGQERTATLTLKQVDNKPFRVLAAKASNPLLRVDLPGKGAATSHKLQVVLGAKAKPGTYMEKVILTLDDPDQPELEIRVSASLR